MTQPAPGPFGAIYRIYFNHLVPVIAGRVSGDPAAYRYLPHSLRGFPDAAALAGMLRDAGLADVRVRLLGGGAVALHTSVKPG
jgi:demethylmenaquinone methyltransferase/2-methoxy-6-polyprenyl-1,4-benzoquinol methylase